MATSKKDATKASKLLRSSKSSAAVRSVAGSDLSQARKSGGKPKGGKKK